MWFHSSKLQMCRCASCKKIPATYFYPNLELKIKHIHNKISGWSPRHQPKICSPPSRLPHQIFTQPPAPSKIEFETKQQFSCYNPIKTAFLAVVIAPAPILFSFHTLWTHRSC